MHAIVNEHLKRPLLSQAISATLLEDSDQQREALYATAGIRNVTLENIVFATMWTIGVDFELGAWNYFQLSNGGFYMAPKTDQTVDLACANGFEHEVCANTAGIIVTAMAYSRLALLPNGDRFNDAYQRLSDFIFQHRDAGIIRAALD
ncbi:antirestriction protein [Massilia sp. DJPM01]|uniref:antirestriction protein n=1 Tax=Massilia sp. DJPM01 TaxID=3024404 RepID=UPI00259EB978|nr:antirestriction protein [Massilia sp. DJPM01]MDM5181909.1 antirestriction protein [Massilia sp. DJPM01]